MKNSNLPFGKKNYRIMLIGLAVLVLGFITMSLDSEEFGFGILGLWVGPLVILAGFGIQFFAILTHDDVPAIEKPTATPLKRTATATTTQAKSTPSKSKKTASTAKRRKRK